MMGEARGRTPRVFARTRTHTKLATKGREAGEECGRTAHAGEFMV